MIASRYTDPGPSRSRAKEYQDDSAVDYQRIAQKDREFLRKHDERHRGRRARSAVIYNRRDQTHPDAYII
ncbi:hypothetical protein L596_015177 [Steinernema carpocapsae]|uniref:Uncharacterized protein n=1 Tax=Steinernema carpocapsae TaxID=34508 RepID=A0A4U5NF35_STECR|nr:hypothetical protein L596_015177 [Steinernema carpocapsae]